MLSAGLMYLPGRSRHSMARFDSRLICRCISMPSLSAVLVFMLFAQAALPQNLPAGARLDHMGLRSGTDRLEPGRDFAYHPQRLGAEVAVEHPTKHATQRHRSFDAHRTAGRGRREHRARRKESGFPAWRRRHGVRTGRRYGKSFLAEDLRQSRCAHLACYLAVLEHGERYSGDR